MFLARITHMHAKTVVFICCDTLLYTLYFMYTLSMRAYAYSFLHPWSGSLFSYNEQLTFLVNVLVFLLFFW